MQNLNKNHVYAVYIIMYKTIKKLLNAKVVFVKLIYFRFFDNRYNIKRIKKAAHKLWLKTAAKCVFLTILLRL